MDIMVVCLTHCIITSELRLKILHFLSISFVDGEDYLKVHLHF